MANVAATALATIPAADHAPTEDISTTAKTAPQQVRWLVFAQDLRGKLHFQQIRLPEDLTAKEVGAILAGLEKQYISRAAIFFEKAILAQKRVVMTQPKHDFDQAIIHGDLESGDVVLSHKVGAGPRDVNEVLSEIMHRPAAAAADPGFVTRFPELAVDTCAHDAQIVVLGRQLSATALAIATLVETGLSVVVSAGIGLIAQNLRLGIGLAVGALFLVALVKLVIVKRSQ